MEMRTAEAKWRDRESVCVCERERERKREGEGLLQDVGLALLGIATKLWIFSIVVVVVESA